MSSCLPMRRRKHSLLFTPVYLHVHVIKQKEQNKDEEIKSITIIIDRPCKAKPKELKHFIPQVFIIKTHMFCIFVVIIGEGHKLESFGE